MSETIKLKTGVAEDVILNISSQKQAREAIVSNQNLSDDVKAKFMDIIDRTLLEKKMPQKVKYRLARLLDKIERELKSYNKLRAEDAEKYCIKVDGKPQMTMNGGYQIDPQFQQEFNDKVRVMREEEIDLGLVPIEFDLESEEAEDLSVEDMMLLIKLNIIKEK